jgi:hypothetical protein
MRSLASLEVSPLRVEMTCRRSVLVGGEISPRVTFADNCKISLARRNILSFTCPSIITMGLFKNWARKGDQISTSEDPYAIEIKFAARRNL